MPRLELQNLLRPNTTPEQELLLEHFYSRFDNGSAANKRIVNVEPLFYQGAIAGTEFLVYAATKMYICYNIALSTSAGITITIDYGEFYNESNIISLYLRNDHVFWDVAVNDVRYARQTLELSNFIFSRFVPSVINYISFVGYRVTLI